MPAREQGLIDYISVRGRRRIILNKGCTYQVAVRALAFKWIRILHRCWQNRTPYDESKDLEALRRKGSPLLKYLAEPA